MTQGILGMSPIHVAKFYQYGMSVFQICQLNSALVPHWPEEKIMYSVSSNNQNY